MGNYRVSFKLLLPYSSESRLRNRKQKIDFLKFIYSLLLFFHTYIKKFIDNELNNFDPQVGENLCQIRACQILFLTDIWLNNAENKLSLVAILEEISNFITSLSNFVINFESLISVTTHYHELLDCDELMEEFLEKHKLNLFFHEDLVYIAACSFLTYFNTRDPNGIPIAVDLNRISKEIHISKFRAKKIVHKYQLLLCESGCNFIFNLVNWMDKKNQYEIILRKLLKIGDEERQMLPCFLVSKILFNFVEKTKKIVLIKIKRKYENENHSEDLDVLYFLFYLHDQEKIELVKISTGLLKANCLIIYGDVVYKDSNKILPIEEYAEYIYQRGLINVVLANIAHHPQYSGRILKNYRDQPYKELDSQVQRNFETELDQKRDFAERYGCCKSNQSGFFLRHIYANVMEKEINVFKNSSCLKSYDANQFIDQREKIE